MNVEIQFPYKLVHQGVSAELIAEKWGLTRAALDDYAYESHCRAMRAIQSGWFEEQILPVERPDGQVVTVDEGVRMPPDRERMARLKTAFKGNGVVTAGNASQISDGASALVLASPEAVGRYNFVPRARILARAVVGSDPVLMLDGPIPATRQVLKRAGLELDDIDVIEINEAFASVVLAWAKELEVSDMQRRESERRRDCHGAPIGRFRGGADDQAALRAGAARRAVRLADNVHRSWHGHGHDHRADLAMAHVVLALGTNLGDRAANLAAARKALAPQVTVTGASQIYETPPWGVTDQPVFLNQVLEGQTNLEPRPLLDLLKRLESELGRRPGLRYGPRLIDLDILFYDDRTISEPELEIPHPRIPERAFVLVPLADLLPGLSHPVLGMTVRDLLARVNAEGVRPYQPDQPEGLIYPSNAGERGTADRNLRSVFSCARPPLIIPTAYSRTITCTRLPGESGSMPPAPASGRRRSTG